MTENEIAEILGDYKHINLHELESSLMVNRVDTKFIFPAVFLTDILRNAQNHYSVLDINDQQNFIYNTTYLDTKDYTLFYHHLRGKLNREKIRYRVYESTGVSYLEIKTKSNKRRTSKVRIKNELINLMPDTKAISFLMKNSVSPVSELKPILNNRFNRITLANLEANERVTIDFNLNFSDLNGNSKSLPFLAIAELKQERISNQSPFMQITKSMNIRPSGFSKYCIGCVLVYNLPQYNAFKLNLLTLEKIKNDCNFRNSTGFN